MHNGVRTTNRYVSHDARRGRDQEEEEEGEGEDLRETEAMDEGLESDDILKAITKGSQEDVAEKLVMHLETHPDDPEARAMVKFFVRKMYIRNGGLPFNKTNPIPFDLESLSNEELSNVLENMVVYSARSKQKDLVGRAMNSLTNLGYIFGGDEQAKVIDQIQSDETLRSSLFEVFLGTKFGPLLSLCITCSSHLTNLARNFVQAKRNGQRTAGGTATQGTNSSESARTSSGVSSNGSN
jgi:hypothetical protein